MAYQTSKKETEKRVLPTSRGWPRKFSSFLRFQTYRSDKISVSSVIVALDGTGDFDNIQAAIDSLPDTGGEVLIKQGTYVLKKQLTLDKSNITISGNGRSSIIRVTSDIHCMTISYANQVILQNLFFYSTAGDWIGLEMLRISNCTNSIIRNCFFNAPDCGGISMGSSTLTQTNNQIINNVFEDTGNVSIGVGKETYVIISGNIFRGSPAYCISTGASNSLISGNSFVGTPSVGIYLDGATYIKILGNVIKDCSQQAIALTSSASNNIISNNDIGSSNYGVYITTSSDNNLISNNDIHDNTFWGIQITSHPTVPDSTSVLGNKLIGNGSGPLDNNGTDTQIGHNITS